MEKNKKSTILIVLVIVVLAITGVGAYMVLQRENSETVKQEVVEKDAKLEIEEKVKLAVQAVLANESEQKEIKKEEFLEELNKNFENKEANLEYDENKKEYTVTVEDYEIKVSSKGEISEAVKLNISIRFILSHTEQVPSVGGNVAEIRDENVPIPTGFTYVEGTKNTGLVIKDAEENEFVWVPVNQNQKLRLEVTSRDEITGMKLIGADGKETTPAVSGKTFNHEIEMAKNGVYVVEVSTANETRTVEKRISSLYAQDLEMEVISNVKYKKQNPDYNTIDEVLSYNGCKDIEELLKKAGSATLAEYFAKNEIYVEGYEKEYKIGMREFYNKNYIDNAQNVESVNKYGGFYIARYEAGDGITESARTATTSDSNKLVSKKGAYVYNYVNRETSEKLAKELEGSNKSVTSQLITGAGWDRTLDWIIETGDKTENEVMIDSRSWGNYQNSTGNAEKNSGSENMNYTTGRSEYWKANNIYNLAGNAFEWTQEQTATDSVYRGGYFYFNGDSYTASTRNPNDSIIQIDSISFRVQLYINV